jgi:hypothetical protein
MIATESVPVPASLERRILSGAVMFQEGRTVTTVEHANHLANEFGKGILRKSFEREGKFDLLEFLPKVKITMPGAVMDAIGQHLAMSMLIDDLDCTLFLNRTNEDFLTSDHPVALCNSLPSSSPFATSGFASRGLIIALPLSPRALVLSFRFALSLPLVVPARYKGGRSPVCALACAATRIGVSWLLSLPPRPRSLPYSL